MISVEAIAGISGALPAQAQAQCKRTKPSAEFSRCVKLGNVHPARASWNGIYGDHGGTVGIDTLPEWSEVVKSFTPECGVLHTRG